MERSDSEESEEHDTRRRNRSKNEQIYGDFVEAYEEQQKKPARRPINNYSKFKAGATIQNYSAQVEVDIPKQKRKVTPQQQQEKPVIGMFNLSSFLNYKNGLQEIEEEDQMEGQGLNNRIIAHLKLTKQPEEDQGEIIDIQSIDYEKYLKATKPQPTQKYKTQEERQLAKQFKDGYGVGFKMMEKMGFKVNKGLGKDQSGINKPVQAIFKNAFTQRDREDDEDEDEQSSIEQQKSIDAQLFEYRSLDPKINKFLSSLKSNFLSLSTQINALKLQIPTLETDQQTAQSISLQKQNKAAQLREQILKLSQMLQDTSNGSLWDKQPHLAIKYGVELLVVSQSIKAIKEMTIAQSGQINQIMNKLSTTLNSFYLNKEQQTLREYSMQPAFRVPPLNSTANLLKSKQNTPIDVDAVRISDEDQLKINQYLAAVVSHSFLKKVESSLQVMKLNRSQNNCLIQAVQIIKKYDPKEGNRLVEEYVAPTCKKYLKSMNLDQWDEESQNNANPLPHLTVFPWLTVIKPVQLDLKAFYQHLSSKIWNFQSQTFLRIVSPFLQFSSLNQKNYLLHFYIYPRLHYYLSSFSLSNPQQSIKLLKMLKEYLPLLNEKSLRKDLLQDILSEIRSVWKRGVGDKQETKKWLQRWKKQIDKIEYGYFQEYMREQ